MTKSSVEKTIEAVWRIEAPRLLGGLVRLVRDVGLAEDLAQEALMTALVRWPEDGIPERPGAWLMATMKNRALDELRKRKMVERKHATFVEEEPSVARVEADFERALEGDGGDDVLRLVLASCHPVLSPEARVALTLRLVSGLTTEEIARGFLVPEPTIAQRIVRAKRTLTEAKVPFEVPRGSELRARLSSVLDVVYLVFNEGYAATRGEDWIRFELCDDALRLARILAALAPEEAEVFGLLSLLELQASRFRTRIAPDGTPVLLFDQDRARWDRLLIERGLAALARAESLAVPLGPFTLQAAIAACHARARTPAETDWERIVALYDALVEVTGSPVVELNRAVAVAMAFGPDEGLALVDELVREEVLSDYHHLSSVRGDFLVRLGRLSEAAGEFERAASLAKNERERSFLLARARDCALAGRAPGRA